MRFPRLLPLPVFIPVVCVPAPDGHEWCVVCRGWTRHAVFGEGVLSFNLCQHCGQSAMEEIA